MKHILLTILIGLFLLPSFAQEKPEKDKRPVRAPFESEYILDAYTAKIPTKGTLEFILHHRFGTMTNGSSDLWGIYAPANIRMGLNYSLHEKIQIGVGITKFKIMTDAFIKINILEQTRSNSMPIGVALIGDMGFDGRSNETFGKNYKFSNRMNYFSQLILTRKITSGISIQVAPSFTHYNMTDTLIEHDKVAISVAGRFRVSPQTSIVVSYDQPLHIKGMQEYNELTNKPIYNLGIGVEISTSTHAFHIFLNSSQKILPQETVMFNQNDFFNRGILLGFNMTRLWSF